MPHPDGDSFLDRQTVQTNIDDYRDASISIHASHYLSRFVSRPPCHEPLVPALGGEPFSIKTRIMSELQAWRDNLGLKLYFVFDGQGGAESEELAMRESKNAQLRVDSAWALYSQSKGAEAVLEFGKSGAVKAYHFQRFLQVILIELGIPFDVAPYSACAQLAYLDASDDDRAMGIMGPAELLVYNINECIITDIDIDNGRVSGLVKSQLLKKLNIADETFVDSFLMTGMSMVPTFPPLMDTEIVTKQPYTIVDALNMLRTAGKSVAALCATWSESLMKHEPRWQDMYQKARMAIKHSIVVDNEGNVVVARHDELTEDNNEYIGLQLAPELYHYQAKGLVSPRVLGWYSSLKMYEHAPLDGGQTAEYQQLITKSLLPIQEQAISLGASKMHRAFQHKNIEKKFWDDSKKTVVLAHRDVNPRPQDQASSWAVSEDVCKKYTKIEGDFGSLLFALASLEDDSFRVETLKREKIPKAVKTSSEVQANVIWRMLHLRGYINKDHGLTAWGRALLQTVRALPSKVQEEPAFLAYELLRLGFLTVDEPHSELVGGPVTGTPEQNKLALLISRAACLLPFRHKKIGFTGPLSRNLLAYHSLTTTLRETERDLVETVAFHMFLSAQAERKGRDDWEKLGPSLPFGHNPSVAMAIAVKHFLDENQPKEKYDIWPISHAVDSLGDLDLAFKFFDALVKGIKTLGKDELKDQQLWGDAQKYLNERREGGK